MHKVRLVLQVQALQTIHKKLFVQRHHGQKKVTTCMQKGPGMVLEEVQKGSKRGLGGVSEVSGRRWAAKSASQTIFIAFFDFYFFEALLGAQNGAHSDQN